MTLIFKCLYWEGALLTAKGEPLDWGGFVVNKLGIETNKWRVIDVTPSHPEEHVTWVSAIWHGIPPLYCWHEVCSTLSIFKTPALFMTPICIHPSAERKWKQAEWKTAWQKSLVLVPKCAVKERHWLLSQPLPFVQLHRITSKAAKPFEQVLLKSVLSTLCLLRVWLRLRSIAAQYGRHKMKELAEKACQVRSLWSWGSCLFKRLSDFSKLDVVYGWMKLHVAFLLLLSSSQSWFLDVVIIHLSEVCFFLIAFLIHAFVTDSFLRAHYQFFLSYSIRQNLLLAVFRLCTWHSCN